MKDIGKNYTSSTNQKITARSKNTKGWFLAANSLHRGMSFTSGSRSHHTDVDVDLSLTLNLSLTWLKRDKEPQPIYQKWNF